MAQDNSWKTIAEVYRNREHTLIQAIQSVLSAWTNNTMNEAQFAMAVDSIVATHLRCTGRSSDKTVEVPVIISPVDDARSELLALLGVSGAPEGASSQPIHIRTRKVRSDKGQPRGPRKVKV